MAKKKTPAARRREPDAFRESEMLFRTLMSQAQAAEDPGAAAVLRGMQQLTLRFEQYTAWVEENFELLSKRLTKIYDRQEQTTGAIVSAVLGEDDAN